MSRELSEQPGRSTGSTARSTSGMSERWWSRAVLGNYLTPVSRLLPPDGHPSAGAGSLVLGCGARHVGGADAFEREAVARALIDDAAQLLGECDPGVAAGERRQRGDRVGDLVGAGEQAVGGAARGCPGCRRCRRLFMSVEPGFTPMPK